MPSERREIIFSHSELCEAIVDYFERDESISTQGEFNGLTLSEKGEVSAIAEYFDTELNQKLNIRVGVSEIGAALMLYCLKARIPLPKFAEKAIQFASGNVALIVTIDAPQETVAADDEDGENGENGEG